MREVIVHHSPKCRARQVTSSARAIAPAVIPATARSPERAMEST